MSEHNKKNRSVEGESENLEKNYYAEYLFQIIICQ
jgi:hypothetical protein